MRCVRSFPLGGRLRASSGTDSLSRRSQELMLYLLQLVQALKFEPAPPPSSPSASSISPSASLRHSHVRHSTRSTASPGAGGSSAAPIDVPTLEDFLVERSARNPVLGNTFYWYIQVEREDKARGRLFDEVARKFERRIKEVRSALCFSLLRPLIFFVSSMSEHEEADGATRPCSFTDPASPISSAPCAGRASSSRASPSSPRLYACPRTLAPRRSTSCAPPSPRRRPG